MELKDKIDIIGKSVEIIKIKLLIFISIAGGAWVYALKDGNLFFLKVILWLTFATCVLGMFTNMYRLGTYMKKLEELNR